MKRLRWPLLVLILIAAALSLAPLVPLGSLKPEVEARLSELFNRQVEIGSMRLSLLGGPYFTLRRVAVSISPEFGDGNLLEAEKVSANLAVLPLLSGNVQIEALEFDSPRVSLVRNPGGVWNWTTAGRPKASVRAQFPRSLTIATMSLTGVAVIGSLEVFEARNASVRVIDSAEAGLPERLYRNVNLTAFIQPAPGNTGPTPAGFREF